MSRNAGLSHEKSVFSVLALVVALLVIFCGMVRADLVGGTFTSGTVNPTNWDQVNGQTPFYTTFPSTNSLSATASVGSGPPTAGSYAQYVLVSETITPRQTNWVLTGLATLTGGASAGQPSLHIFDESSVLTGAYSNSSSASYYIVATNGTGGDLLGGGYGLTYAQPATSFGTTYQEIFTLTNGPTSTDQIVLGANRKYAVELWVPVATATALSWMRTAATTPVDANAGGQAMSGGDAAGIGMTRLTLSANGQAGTSPRTFALALYGYATNAPYTVSTSLPLLTNDVPPPVTTGTCIVNWTNVYQRIDGFGASSAWLSISTAEGTLLYSTNNNITYKTSTATNVCNGVGLSLLRNHIIYANTSSASAVPTTGEISVMQQAQSYGARVWSTPWTPPVGFKNTNNLYGSLPITNSVNGGSYLGSGGNVTNVNYAKQLANYVASMKNTYGINLYGISIQNEPDAQVNTYEACQWTGSEIHDFVTNLYPALLAQSVSSTKIILPESQNWSDPQNLGSPSLADPNVAADVGVVACHNYDGLNGPATLTKNSSGKPLWETEVAMLSGSDSSIANGVYYAQRIYLYMTQANANAYHYWWLVSGSSTSGNEGLLDNGGNITKRLFAFGQYSRFVRPNYYRIDATNTTFAMISAYRDTNSGNFAIVAVNTNASYDVTQTFNFTNFTATTVTPWITSATLNLTPQSSVTVTNGSFTYDVPAQSIVTFVGQGTTNFPPVFTPVSNVTVNPGVTVQVTNTATAYDVPPYSLTYSAANTFPSGATINPASGIFTWRPSVSQANTTNQIKVAATDSDSAGLSATNSFSVIVNSITNPIVSSGNGGGNVSFSPGQFSMTVSGPQGPDYTLLESTDLVNWQSIFTTNSPATPFTFTDPNATNANQYYEIQIGP